MCSWIFSLFSRCFGAVARVQPTQHYIEVVIHSETAETLVKICEHFHANAHLITTTNDYLLYSLHTLEEALAFIDKVKKQFSDDVNIQLYDIYRFRTEDEAHAFNKTNLGGYGSVHP